MSEIENLLKYEIYFKSLYFIQYSNLIFALVLPNASLGRDHQIALCWYWTLNFSTILHTATLTCLVQGHQYLKTGQSQARILHHQIYHAPVRSIKCTSSYATVKCGNYFVKMVRSSCLMLVTKICLTMCHLTFLSFI